MVVKACPRVGRGYGDGIARYFPGAIRRRARRPRKIASDRPKCWVRRVRSPGRAIMDHGTDLDQAIRASAALTSRQCGSEPSRAAARSPHTGGRSGSTPTRRTACGARLWVPPAPRPPGSTVRPRLTTPPPPPPRPAAPPRRASSGRTEPRKKTDSSVGARPGILIPDGVLGDVEILLHVTSLGERECCRSYLRHTSIDEQFGARHVAALVRRE